MVLPAAWLMAPPAVVVNESVTEMGFFEATRFEPEIANVGLSTLSPIGPEASRVGLLLASFEVRIDTLAAPAVTAPIVSPLTVTVTAVLTAMEVVPVSVNTTAVAVGVAAEAVVSLPLRAAVGLPDAAKKSEG